MSKKRDFSTITGGSIYEEIIAESLADPEDEEETQEPEAPEDPRENEPEPDVQDDQEAQEDEAEEIPSKFIELAKEALENTAAQTQERDGRKVAFSCMVDPELYRKIEVYTRFKNESKAKFVNEALQIFFREHVANFEDINLFMQMLDIKAKSRPGARREND